MQPSDEEVLELVSRFGSAPENHRSGEPVLDVVFADPGTNGFYYRERKSDSVAAFIRVDHIAALALSRGDALAKAEAENARLRRALINIDAFDPEGSVEGFSRDALAGLVRRMGEIARAALGGDDA
jgi:hypothetical protein